MNGDQHSCSSDDLSVPHSVLGSCSSLFILHPSSFILAFLCLYVVAAAALFGRFFWLYPFSAASLLTLVVAAFCYREAQRDPRRGLLLLSFVIPLVGSLPHLAPIRCPPPLLLMVAGFALGWFVRVRRERRGPDDRMEEAGAVGVNGVAVLFLLFAVSGLLTSWRYLSNAPLGGWPALDALINVRQATASDAIANIGQTLVVALSGPLLFLLATTIALDQQWLSRWARALLAGVLLAFLIGLAQLLFVPSLGNDPYWARNSRINATFTDPNALGTFVALVFPLAAALAVGGRDAAAKSLGAVVAVLSLLMLGGSGSRTGAGGVLLAAALFPAALALRFRLEGELFRQRVLFASLAVAIAVVAFTPASARSQGKQWVLLGRLAKTREVVERQGLLAPLLRDRWPLWEPAVHITTRYPIAGIGLGGFSAEVENFARLAGRRWPRFDNANNFYLQVSSELGLLGLAVVVAVLGTILAAMVRVVRSPRLEGESRAIYAAITVSWITFLVMFLTGPHLFFEQNQAAFWLFAAAFAAHGDFRPKGDSRRRRWLTVAGIAVVAVIAAFQSAHAFGNLSLARRRVALGLEAGEGFYPRETDETGRRFRWIADQARLSVPTTRGEIRIELRAGNPDLATRPLGVWISLNGRATSFEITTPDWRWLRLPVPPATPNPAELHIRVERTWRPTDFGHPKDNRALGIAIARIENADPRDPLPP